MFEDSFIAQLALWAGCCFPLLFFVPMYAAAKLTQYGRDVTLVLMFLSLSLGFTPVHFKLQEQADDGEGSWFKASISVATVTLPLAVGGPLLCVAPGLKTLPLWIKLVVCLVIPLGSLVVCPWLWKSFTPSRKNSTNNYSVSNQYNYSTSSYVANNTNEPMLEKPKPVPVATPVKAVEEKAADPVATAPAATQPRDWDQSMQAASTSGELVSLFQTIEAGVRNGSISPTVKTTLLNGAREKMSYAKDIWSVDVAKSYGAALKACSERGAL